MTGERFLVSFLTFLEARAGAAVTVAIPEETTPRKAMS